MKQIDQDERQGEFCFLIENDPIILSQRPLPIADKIIKNEKKDGVERLAGVSRKPDTLKMLFLFFFFLGTVFLENNIKGFDDLHITVFLAEHDHFMLFVFRAVVVVEMFLRQAVIPA